MPLVSYLHRVVARESLSAGDARNAMLAILSGASTTVHIAAFLTALKMKGETAEELVGFARAMREKAVPVDAGLGGELLIDTCGTGGDGGRTFNISTVAAFVAAGAGVRVAKHGNRSLSSQCGSADVLEELGVNISMPPALAARAIREAGIGFLFAPAIHPAMKYAQPARAELKMRTVFNLLGPLTNPARATVQLIGAPSLEAAALMAEALAQLGIARALVVHGSDGLDEITTTGETAVFEINGAEVRRNSLTPEDFGVSRALPRDLEGGDRTYNAGIMRGILTGDQGPRTDIVLVNAAAALVVANFASTREEAMRLARISIASGKAYKCLEELRGIR
ncbi:MAG TPA: anthranilate phosphoribosyltransferase [Bryobacteraceae bacterium]|nr:anthranilate phosphoribosyltransferase [Bryobacteraceae bacterium]